MQTRSTLAIVLAAGIGKRMNSAQPKVLHNIGGAPMIDHVLAALKSSQVDQVAVVIGPGEEVLREHIEAVAPDVRIYVQEERLGTAHAVLAARQALDGANGTVLVLFGDSPLVQAETIDKLRGGLANGSAVAVGGMEPPDPSGYGRLIMEGDTLLAIREDRDASPDERMITLCNGGLMALSGTEALNLLDAVGNNNAQGEYYLTDCVEIARTKGLSTSAVTLDYRDLIGVNDRAQLAIVEARFQDRKRLDLMQSGVTMIAPETVFVSFDTLIEPDVILEPHIVFASGVTVRSGAIIHSFCHLESAEVGEGAKIGPFARLRPGTRLGTKVKVGNFCELKNAIVAEGAKINHLSYVGDATVGQSANIGAGTITCNYDGINKFQTIIGDGAFIGSNSALVAPVVIGDGAYVATGSVITDDVSPHALALARSRQVEKPGRAKLMRETRTKT